MEALQGWRSSEGELALATATAGLRELGGCCCEEEKPRQRENGVRLSAGGHWRDEGALGRGVACADRPAATHGRFPRHAAAMLYAGRPLCRSIQFVSRAMQCLTMSFDTPLTANP